MLRFLILSLAILGLLLTETFGISQKPWRDKSLLIPEDFACYNQYFDGGPIDNSYTYLSVYSDRPVWIIIHNGERFIRENVRARRRLNFNFINKNGFSIEVCRLEFDTIQKYQNQKKLLQSGRQIPEEEKIPELDKKLTEAFKIYFTSN